MRRVLLGIAMLCTLVGGCASRSGASRSVTAPTMLSSTRPDWRLPAARSTGVVLDLRISVQVDATGRPMMETLDVTGLGANDNRDAVAEWVRTARFRPAQQAGQAIEGVFQTRVQARSAMRRMG